MEVKKCNECETTLDAAEKNHKKCLEYLVANGISDGSLTWHPVTTCAATTRGYREILEYCVENGCPWDPETTYAAAVRGYKELLEYCLENGCPCHPKMVHIAASFNQTEILEYIFENCGDFISWEDSKLEEHMGGYIEEIQEYLLSIKEEWCSNSRSKYIKG